MPSPFPHEQVGPGTQLGSPGAQGSAVRPRDCCTMLVKEVRQCSPTRTPPSFTYSGFAHGLQLILPVTAVQFLDA